ncbi:MAG: glutamine-hydrolyzing GMP synthase [Defluviitaleaceae bacterium]|nr:glutamine-hydrolyzing GMP synthase [Defluviitaleaceae bacterium]
MKHEMILVMDFGGQYKELIARGVRTNGVYSEIRPGSFTAEKIKELAPIGIILTGGPKSVYLEDSYLCDPEIFTLGIPVLGICYGMQMMVHMLGGKVSSGDVGEYGQVDVLSIGVSKLLPQGNFKALMSHRDSVAELPQGFITTAKTDHCIAAIENDAKKLYGLQFHPETDLTAGGKEVLRRFLMDICGASGDYELKGYEEEKIDEIRAAVGDGERVLLALSGGVDSSVCAALLSRAIPGRLDCIFVDHGFMRHGEPDAIEAAFANDNINFVRIDASARFLEKLVGVEDPEAKRKIIGHEFIAVFEEEAKKLGDVQYFAQGTIYPDIVESGGEYGAVIKSHHNVGGLPEKLGFKQVIEPLAGLFKDEVRALGAQLGLPENIVYRQPFPGPGLAIRCIGELTREKLDILRTADYITTQEIEANLDPKPAQYFCVLTNTKSVGVKGDARTYDPVIAVRAVTTQDFMTAEYFHIPHDILMRISQRITREIKGVSRVVYDITSKPPGTVEWE